MDPRIRDLAPPSDPRIGRAVTGAGAGAARPVVLDPRIRRGQPGDPAGAPAPAGPSVYDPGNLPDPDPHSPGAAPPWWDPTARRHPCPDNLPGEYHPQQASAVYRPLLNSTAEVHAIGGSLLSAADREAVERPLAKFLAAYAVPNASLALLDGSGRLVHCTGLTNLGVYQSIHQQPAWAGPHSSFRVGSVSKTLTAWAIMKLADLGIVPNMQAHRHPRGLDQLRLRRRALRQGDLLPPGPVPTQRLVPRDAPVPGHHPKASQGMGYGWESGGWHGNGSWFKVGHVSGGGADVYHEGTSPGSRGLTMAVMYNRFPFTGDEATDKATDRAMRKLVAAAMQAMTLPTGGQDLFHVQPP